MIETEKTTNETLVRRKNGHINFELPNGTKMIVFGDPTYPTPEGATIKDEEPGKFFYRKNEFVDATNTTAVQSNIDSAEEASPTSEQSE